MISFLHNLVPDISEFLTMILYSLVWCLFKQNGSFVFSVGFLVKWLYLLKSPFLLKAFLVSGPVLSVKNKKGLGTAFLLCGFQKNRINNL